MRVVLGSLFRFRVTGLANVPEGGAIVSGNHISGFDPPVVGMLMKRPAWYIAKEELFRYPGFRWLISQVHAYPVRRGKPDRRALRMTQAIVAHGGIVIMFPEGHRTETGELQDPRRGVAFVARVAGVPVVPVGVAGPYRLGRPVALAFGPPLTMEPGESLDAFSSRLMAAIREQVRAAGELRARGVAGLPRSV